MAGPDTCEFTDGNFESEVLQSDTPVLVDFWAEWCMPCKTLSPIIDELATDNSGKIKVGKMDTDANREMPVKYAVQAIPTVLIFKGGEMVDKFVGLKSKKDLQEALDRAAG